MVQQLHGMDWLVIGCYLLGLILFSFYLSRRQHSREDYYVGNHGVGPWAIAVSTMATQCSTNSILGAPAFVAFTLGGGLVWLQYELAVPLAMIVIMVFLLPVFLRLQLISVYEYLEKRFDLKTRLVLSGLFQFVRAFATAVTVYSIALVISLITGLGFFWSVLILGFITLVYDVLGGIRAVIYSDILQMGVLVLMLLVMLVILAGEQGGVISMLQNIPEQRRVTLNFSSHGIGDGEVFAFWPMLIGGLLLYVSYYGCDQSQVQRELCARDIDEGKKALFLNGLLRFPVVLLYCFIGVGIAAFVADNPGFVDSLPIEEGAPNYNLAVPLLMMTMLPVGVVGLVMVALFAAAMSSLDSVINSLSATTMEDFVRRFKRGYWSPAQELMWSRLLTLVWGLLTMGFAFLVGNIADTVLEAINIIGSLINGPVLGVFAMGLLTTRANGNGAVSGLLAGFGLNLYCWMAVPLLSWLWWNLFGFLMTVAIGMLVSVCSGPGAEDESYTCYGQPQASLEQGLQWKRMYWLLSGWSVLIFSLLFVIGGL